jgi:hypothetical protein
LTAPTIFRCLSYDSAVPRVQTTAQSRPEHIWIGELYSTASLTSMLLGGVLE